MNFSEYVIKRLGDYGIDHIFGIPGDYILPFFDVLVSTEGVTHVGSTNEQAAVHAADGYARINGVGAAVVTYGPGAFNGVNAIAAAFTENVPVIFISGVPGTSEAPHVRLYHHVIQYDLDKSIRIFKEITAAAVRLENIETACEEFDALVALAVQQKLPVYVEVPYNFQTHPVVPKAAINTPPPDSRHSKQAADRITETLKNTSKVALLPGLLVERFQLEDALYAFLAKSRMTFATLFDAKAGYLESLPNCIGFYQGAMTCEPTRRAIEESDVLLLLGGELNEFNSGMFTAKVQSRHIIRVGINFVAFGDERVEGTYFPDVWRHLCASVDELVRLAPDSEDHFEFTYTAPFTPRPEQRIVVDRLYQRLSHYFRERDIVLGDAGAYVNLTRVRFRKNTRVLGNGNWGSLGHGFGMSIGIAFTDLTARRLIGVIGDGSFQMTGQEFSNLVRFNKNYTLIILNNKGYTAERAIQPEVDSPYNDIQDWRYHQLNAFMGGESSANGVEVHTEADLERALEQAEKQHGPFVINVHLGKLDVANFNLLMSKALKH